MDIIERLQEATGPDRELDEAIYEHLHGPEGDEPWPESPPHYTTSLDAALTLVPEGWDWGRDKTEAVFVYEKTWLLNERKGRCFTSTAPTPALALCVASLRARREQEDG